MVPGDFIQILAKKVDHKVLRELVINPEEASINYKSLHAGD